MNNFLKNASLVILQIGITAIFTIGLFWFWQLPEKNWYMIIALAIMGVPVVYQKERFWFSLTIQLFFMGLSSFMLYELDTAFAIWGNIFFVCAFSVLFVASYISLPGISSSDTTDKFLNQPIIYWPWAIITTFAFLALLPAIFYIIPEFWSGYVGCLYGLILNARSIKSKIDAVSTMSE